jgi:hypothetical protein
MRHQLDLQLPQEILTRSPVAARRRGFAAQVTLQIVAFADGIEDQAAAPAGLAWASHRRRRWAWSPDQSSARRLARHPGDRCVADAVHSAAAAQGREPLQVSLRRCLFVRPSHRESVRLADSRASCHEGARTLAKQGHSYDFSGRRGMWSCPGIPVSACPSWTAFF